MKRRLFEMILGVVWVAGIAALALALFARYAGSAPLLTEALLPLIFMVWLAVALAGRRAIYLRFGTMVRGSSYSKRLNKPIALNRSRAGGVQHFIAIADLAHGSMRWEFSRNIRTTAVFQKELNVMDRCLPVAQSISFNRDGWAKGRTSMASHAPTTLLPMVA